MSWLLYQLSRKQLLEEVCYLTVSKPLFPQTHDSINSVLDFTPPSSFSSPSNCSDYQSRSSLCLWFKDITFDKVEDES